MSKESLKQKIDENVTSNGLRKNTGAGLNNVLNSIVDEMITEPDLVEFSLMKVNTIEELRKIEGQKEQIITLLGYYKSGDKEPLNYKFTTVSLVDDGGSVIKGIGGYWVMTSNLNISILDFGIVDDDTIDQSIKLDAHSKYCDDNMIYEIDYLGFNLQTSKTVHQVTARGSRLSGIKFNKAHKLKNLKIKHEKDFNIYQGASLILWLIDYLPKDVEVFELENIDFDPYSKNYTIINGEGDGRLGGFYASKIGEISNIPSSQELNFAFKVNGVNFSSPAISRNISTANIRFKHSECKNLTGEYWALYTHIFATKSFYESSKTIYRDDLQNASTRNLVLTMIHHEPESAGFDVVLDSINIKDCESYAFTDGRVRTVFKHHTVNNSTYHVDSITFDNIIGDIGWSLNIPSTCNILNFKNIKRQVSEFAVTGLNPTSLFIIDSVVPNLQGLLLNRPKKIDDFNIENSTITRSFNVLAGAASVIEKMTLTNVDFDKSAEFNTSGFLRNTGTIINNLKLLDVRNQNSRLFDCIILDLEIDGYHLNNTSYTGHIIMRGNDVSKSLRINSLYSTSLPSGVDNLITNSGTGSTLNFEYYTNSSTLKRIGVNANLEINVFPLRSLTTANLPILTVDNNGYRVYDSTDRNFKVWNGTSWVLDSINKSTNVTNVATANATDLATALTLVNELKLKLNAKLDADRASGQQNTI